MNLNKKGVSLIAMVITIIVIIIIAGISIGLGFRNASQAQKAVFLTDLKNFTESVAIYNERAKQFGKRGYQSYELYWDGQEEYLMNSAKLDYLTNDLEGKKINPKYLSEMDVENIENAPEDTVIFMLNGEIPTSLRGKIYIEAGKPYIFGKFTEQYNWATEEYTYMKEGYLYSPEDIFNNPYDFGPQEYL